MSWLLTERRLAYVYSAVQVKSEKRWLRRSSTCEGLVLFAPIFTHENWAALVLFGSTWTERPWVLTWCPVDQPSFGWTAFQLSNKTFDIEQAVRAAVAGNGFSLARQLAKNLRHEEVHFSTVEGGCQLVLGTLVDAVLNADGRVFSVRLKPR
jgi:hypothetical protein